MGVLLLIEALAGAICGALLSAAGFGVAIVAMNRLKRSRERVWAPMIVGMVLGTLLGIAGAASIEAPETRPGSDYERIGRYWLLTAAAYTAAPGLGALVGLSLILAGRRRTPA